MYIQTSVCILAGVYGRILLLNIQVIYHKGHNSDSLPVEDTHHPMLPERLCGKAGLKQTRHDEVAHRVVLFIESYIHR